jgi:glutathione peroxidase
MGVEMKRLKRIFFITLLSATAFAGYVIYINRNSVNMSTRQKILKAVYPVWMWLTGISGKGTDVVKNNNSKPAVSFYTLQMTAVDGSLFSFESLKGKNVLLVNTASDCGYTDQYAELQKLYDEHKEQLLIVAFPANDFKQQEKKDDEAIALFCKKNYGVSFPLMQKSVVIKSAEQNEVYKWLTDPAKNGWNGKAPSWNFSKYLVNKNGVLTNYFGPSVSPLSDEIQKAIKD